MKVLFLQISDIHFDGIENLSDHLIKVAKALRESGNFNHVYIIFSGDLSYSGDVKQYSFIAPYLKEFENKIKNLYSVGTTILLVPGNHDINHSALKNKNNSVDYTKLSNSKDFKKQEVNELKKLRNYNDFAKTYGCNYDNNLYIKQKVEKIEDYGIEFNLINNGSFSTLNEYKGCLFIDDDAISILKSPTRADLVIGIMHHDYEWYRDELKESFQKTIISKCSILFMGHEHKANEFKISDNDNHTVQKIYACSFYDKNWEASGFNTVLYDTETKKISKKEFKWDKEIYIVNTESKAIKIPYKPSNSRVFQLQNDYLNTLLMTSSNTLDSQDLSTFFVFPRIRKESTNSKSQEFLNFESFFNEIKNKKEINIYGHFSAGKTALLRMLTYYLMQDLEKYKMLPVLIEKNDYKSSSKIKNIIENKIKEMYGSNEVHYFLQTTDFDRILLVDDYDTFNLIKESQSIEYLNRFFSYYIYSEKNYILRDFVSCVEDEIKGKENAQYRIVPFFIDKREELIKKVTKSICVSDSVQEQLRKSEAVIKSFSNRRSVMGSTPDFIVKYVSFFLSNSNMAYNSNYDNIFSKVFETEIVLRLNRFSSNTLSVDKIMTIVQKIAHYIHFNHCYPISDDKLIDVIKKYKDEYGGSFNISDLIEKLKNSQIIVSYSEDSYVFLNENILAYFVAKEIISKSDNDLKKDLNKVIEVACFGINSAILLFVFCLREDVGFLLSLIEGVEQYCDSWKELDIPNLVPEGLLDGEYSDLCYDEEKRNEIKQEDKNRKLEEEKAIENEQIKKSVDSLYKYTVDDLGNVSNQIMRAITLLSLVARCLPSFEHKLKRDQKDKFAKCVFTMPNKIFYKWAEQAENLRLRVLDMLKKEWAHYVEQDIISEEDVNKLFRNISICVLLDLYSIAIGQATRDNTYETLKQVPDELAQKDTYKVESLFLEETKSDKRNFVLLAKSLNKSNHNLTKELVKRLVFHVLIYEKIAAKDQGELKKTFFPTREEQKIIDQNRKPRTR